MHSFTMFIDCIETVINFIITQLKYIIFYCCYCPHDIAVQAICLFIELINIFFKLNY